MNWYRTSLSTQSSSQNDILLASKGRFFNKIGPPLALSTIPAATVIMWLSQYANMPMEAAQDFYEENTVASQRLYVQKQNPSYNQYNIDPFNTNNNAIQQIDTIKQNDPVVENVNNPIQESKKSNKYEMVSNDEMMKILISHEGYKKTAYNDSLGYRTIGIGSCIDLRVRPDSKQRIEALGLNYNKVYNKKISLNDQQIRSLFMNDLNEAISHANNFSEGLTNHPKNVQIVLIDMAFNLGPKLMDFNRLRKSILDKNYDMAGIYMSKSKWYNQVKNRGKNMVSLMKSTNQSE